MKNIPIFDSISHPTISGDWISDKYNGLCNIDILINQMIENNIIKSFAIGMKNIGSYDEYKYIELLKPYGDYLIPIAYYDVYDDMSITDIRNKLLYIKKIGYSGIKLHPRFSNFSLSHIYLPYIISFANELELSVLLCTYFYHNTEKSLYNSISSLNELLYTVDDCKIILLHSGTVKLMEMLEIGRSFKNILLDLSFTLCKYEGSSIDLDIKYAFDNFDERICIGSDYPEFSLTKLRERFEYFSNNLSINKLNNIAYKNLMKYCNLK